MLLVDALSRETAKQTMDARQQAVSTLFTLALILAFMRVSGWRAPH